MQAFAFSFVGEVVFELLFVSQKFRVCCIEHACWCIVVLLLSCLM